MDTGFVCGWGAALRLVSKPQCRQCAERPHLLKEEGHSIFLFYHEPVIPT